MKMALMYSEPFQDKSLLYVPIKGHLQIFSSCDAGYQGHVTESPRGPRAAAKLRLFSPGASLQPLPSDSSFITQSSCCLPRG